MEHFLRFCFKNARLACETLGPTRNILTNSDNTILGCRTYKLGLLAQPFATWTKAQY